MRIVMKLLWKTMVRLLRSFGLSRVLPVMAAIAMAGLSVAAFSVRRLGWGGTLLPLVASMGMWLFGVNPWTVTVVVLALILAFKQPDLARTLVPLSMVCAGLCGLAVAARTPGASPGWYRALFPPAFALSAQSVITPRGSIGLQGFPGQGAGKGRLGLSSPTKAVNIVQAKARPGFLGLPAGAFRAVNRLGQGLTVARPRPAGPWVQVATVAHPAPVPMLVLPVSLLLLAVGLWLLPRTLPELRTHASGLEACIREQMRERSWGLLLVPIAVLAVAAFGWRPWTIIVVIAALVAAIGWPMFAADLVPVALGIFAACGFAITFIWQSRTGGFGPQSSGPVVLYGAVPVDGHTTALLAGAEASAFLALAAWLVPRTIGAHMRGRADAPTAELAGRVRRLTETRDHAVDTATSELRRIERDLHDGAQARLVALGMNLRAAERMLPASPQAALALVGEARESSLRALKELRDLVRGICPPVLADRGLGHAVQALALDTPMPTELDINLPGRLTAPVESACYFAVAEILANAVKHSGARRVYIRIQHAGGMLRIEVADDGSGGADPARGTGLLGVERRLATFDGILAVSSPAGGPTMIAMEIPCALLSPKTYSSSGMG
jgi:signal transduction histidine kinase